MISIIWIDVDVGVCVIVNPHKMSIFFGIFCCSVIINPHPMCVYMYVNDPFQFLLSQIVSSIFVSKRVKVKQKE